MREIEEVNQLGGQNGQLRKPGAGQGTKGGDSEAARKLGIPRTEIRRTRKHVETAAEHPVFQGKNWKRSQVLAAGEALQSIPKRERVAAVEMVSDPFQYWKALRLLPLPAGDVNSPLVGQRSRWPCVYLILWHVEFALWR